MKLSIVILVAGLAGAVIAMIPAVDDLPPAASQEPIEIVDSSEANSDVVTTGENSSDTPSAEAKLAAEVSVGMTDSDVVRIHGNHYRHTLHASFDSTQFVYDDIAVQFYKGRVTHVTPTTAELNTSLKNNYYQDQMYLSIPWQIADHSAFVLNGACDPALQTEDSGSKPIRFSTLQIDLHDDRVQVRR